MSRPDVVDLSLVAACVALAAWTALAQGETPATGVFIAFVYSCLALLGRAAVAGVLRLHREGRRARRLARADPDAVARAAITEERRRLAADIGETLRRAMVEIEGEARTIDRSDPLPTLKRIHAQSQLATSELRRQLGLLREPGAVPDQPRDEPTAGQPLARGDVWFAAGLTLLAALEATAYSVIEDLPLLPWSPVWTALAAATVVGRRRAPAAACVSCAAVYVLASLLGYPVTGGFWLVGTLGGLLWAASARGRWTVEGPAAGLLVAAVSWSRWVDDRDNLPITLVIMGVAVVAGLVSRLIAHLEQASRSRAAAREAELEDATRAAVTAERSGFARDLHDVVSHAVGLIAMQAAAAQVSWPDRPDAVRRSVDVIEETARATLAELERLGPDGPSPRPTDSDLADLVGRIRAAGVTVDLTVLGEPPPTLRPVIQRVVQEALTNAVRHAPGVSVAVTLEVTADEVRVRVVDDGHPATGQGVARGFGLTGLRERVALAGGAMSAGPGPGAAGGFEVDVTLPVRKQAGVP